MAEGGEEIRHIPLETGDLSSAEQTELLLKVKRLIEESSQNKSELEQWLIASSQIESELLSRPCIGGRKVGNRSADVHNKHRSAMEAFRCALMTKDPDTSTLELGSIYNENRSLRPKDPDNSSRQVPDYRNYHFFDDQVRDLDLDELQRSVSRHQQARDSHIEALQELSRRHEAESHVSRLEQIRGELREVEDRVAECEVTCDNLFALLDHFSDVPAVTERCLRFVRHHALPVLASDGLTRASAATFCLMFESGAFKQTPAMARLTNAIRWATEQLPKAVRRKDRRKFHKKIRELLLRHRILGKCGLESLSLAELKTVAGQYVGLLTQDEYAAFLDNAEYRSSADLPLPRWCQPYG